MKISDIKMGGLYTARVNGKKTTVSVDQITCYRPLGYARKFTRYVCTNKTTGRVVVIRSAAKFIGEATPLS